MMRTIVRRRVTRVREPQPTPSLAVARQLLDDVAAGIRVLRTRDGVELSDTQVIERARNIVAGLIGNYRIQSLDPRTARTARAVPQLDLLEQLEKRGRASGGGRSG
jgi:hypothetical protein